MKNIFKILIINLTIYNLNAMNCSNYKSFQQYNGHYYSTSIDKLTFESAKQIAINNGGTLAIPNDSAENSFIQNLIGGGTLAWIGIHDPNKIQNFCYGGACAYDDTRFKTVKNESLSYKNFHPQQPDNLVKEYDEVDGKAMVSPLGEHWVAMNGTNGQWLDLGNHADEYNNPVKYKAVFEFENLNDCTPPTDDGVQELTGRFCNSKVWDETVDVVTMGQTFDCQTDQHGNEYCPEALAPADTYWDYEDGYSVTGVGEVVDYTDKVNKTTTTTTSKVTVTKTLYEVKETCSKICYVKNGTKAVYNTFLGKYTCQWSCNYCDDGDHSYTFHGSCPMDVEACPSGYTASGSICKKTETIKVCPSGYSDNGSNCKKTISYTYYEYLCSDEQNAQGESYTPTTTTTYQPRTDPNTSTVNSSILDDTQGSSTPPANNCQRLGFTCNSNLRTPAWVDGQWQCSPFPCLGESNLENLDTDVGSSDKNNDGWEDDGSCNGTIHIFNGKSNKCRSWDMFFGLTGGGCCDKDKVFLGLVACKENEKLLAEKRKQEHTHYIGEFCSKKLKLLVTEICVQKSKSYCTFNSSLARIIQQQGRAQLGISWGTPENPQCRGFTPDEFQKIDFSKIDLTEFVQGIQSSIQTNVVNNLGTYVKDKVENFYEN